MSPTDPHMRGQGPFWVIPLEVVRACAVAEGVGRLTRLELDNVRFQPHAVVWRREDRFCATIAFEEAKYPGQKQETEILLFAVPKENAR